jgi:hypothetical protein
MEQLVVITDVEPSSNHVWTPTKNDVFWYQEIIAPNTWTLEIENFQFQKTIENSVEFLEKATFETNSNDHSSTMNLCMEHDSHQTILIMSTFIIDSTPISQICFFVKVLHM